TYAPRRVHLVRIASPTIISMTPTMCMKVRPLNGSIFRATGLMYAVQLVKRLKYLSRPARNGPTPSPIRSAHQAWSNRESNPLCMFIPFTRIEWAGANRLQLDASISFTELLQFDL